jgi:tetratricopeptide (TPR) repeat protein
MSPCRPTRLALGLLAAFAASAHADDLLVQADQLLSQQRHQEAYTLLSPLEDERGGDPNYDFLLGRAALASGHHTEAAFAFERCLAVDPKNGPCRMQMAQAHMVLGETDSARLELKTIQEYNPPAEVQSLVAQYMGMLQVSESKAQNQISTYAQATLGHDTNVNSANDQSQIAIPALGGLYFVKDPSGLEQDDNYAQLEAGVRLRRGLSPAWSLLADASLNGRLHQEISDLNSTVLDVGAGGAWRTGPTQVVLKANAQQYLLDGDDYRQLLGGMAQYIYSPSDTSQFSAFVQVTGISYETQALRDARRDTLGGAWSQGIEGWLNPVVYASLYGGQETPDAAGVDHFGQQFVGLRLGGSANVSSSIQLNASVSMESRQYDADDPIFLVTRDDTQIDLNLGMGYRLGKHLSLLPTYTFTSNDSNIVINEFTRHTLSVAIRYER